MPPRPILYGFMCQLLELGIIGQEFLSCMADRQDHYVLGIDSIDHAVAPVNDLAEIGAR